jgi:hypothetical protein
MGEDRDVREKAKNERQVENGGILGTMGGKARVMSRTTHQQRSLSTTGESKQRKLKRKRCTRSSCKAKKRQTTRESENQKSTISLFNTFDLPTGMER